MYLADIRGLFFFFACLLGHKRDQGVLLRRVRAYGEHPGRALQLEGALQPAHRGAVGARVHQAGGERRPGGGRAVLYGRRVV